MLISSKKTGGSDNDDSRLVEKTRSHLYNYSLLDLGGIQPLPVRDKRADEASRRENAATGAPALWALWHVRDTAKKIFQITLIAAAFNIVVGMISGHSLWTSFAPEAFAPAFGVLVGHWKITSRIVNGLLRFDERKAELEREIALLKGTDGSQA